MDPGTPMRRFDELSNEELHVLAAGLHKDRMHGAWMNGDQLDRSEQLQAEMEAEYNRREAEAARATR